jgi:hypothetical protein
MFDDAAVAKEWIIIDEDYSCILFEYYANMYDNE